ncbi:MULTISPECIES: GNAT family N-acetyltransferase [Streptomyces]|uniref:N-acetyltransferase n=1 Tax=Streptomyces tsukubensis (strain DSM 42081 / NBRC 108919 / NRRL 18488 / 9993) TaxID=1114943 RepID=I2N435_STRT9|nr:MULTISPECIES: GNAT family N-acetyltransferase [Streptomyces]AZK95836.1 N-acetyltransferase [Streptomyces tsukubensis]EIF91782.1 GCN5-like N-acetyltransferase [Streptomyces tsukubensis NRRL18488]MYS67571.1 GNAT family N-acetyltransferase [Streptomyces sp. SID5473]QKM68141.1 N-acetyltransferase [Streptomyces tsukubensis NRRL18488]TAI44543.1 N-acetyltransferase [Streptomyces tsukubensis]
MSTLLPAVRLRVPTDEDAVAWHRVFADPEVMAFHGGRAAELSYYEELTARQRRHDAERGFCLWTVLDEDGAVIGFTGAQPWPEQAFGPYGEIEIGWRLARRAWGRGYATAAARTTLERVRAAGVPDVVAMVDHRNERSIAVTRRLGMRQAERYAVPDTDRWGHTFRLELGALGADTAA